MWATRAECEHEELRDVVSAPGIVMMSSARDPMSVLVMLLLVYVITTRVSRLVFGVVIRSMTVIIAVLVALAMAR
jgi:hypothetical protein